MALFNTRRKRFEREAMVHADALYGTAMRLTRNPDSAQDLVQETYLQAFKHFDSLRPDSNLKAWLTRVMTNTFINQYRRKQVRYRSQELYDQDWMNERVGSTWARDAAKRPGQKIVDRFVRDKLNDAVAALPDPYRQVLLLADVEELAYKEVAKTLDIPIGTVMSRLHRARRKLRELLSEYAQIEGEAKVTEFTPRRRQG
jgi:RNA polymerase sigma-70 factor (ECF subfamily)